jgi:multiple sugar transport system permease protein
MHMAARARSRRPGGGIRGREGIAGWVFTAPMIVVLGVFLFIPVLMALYVSLTSWNGNGSPFAGGQNATFVGLDNYSALFTRDGLTRDNFMQSLGNNFWYVVFVVPLQTATSFFLALVVSNRFLKGKSFFRTAFYFPSVTSSIAISVVFLFLFQNSGAVNALLALVGIDGPAWFSDSRGLFHIAFGAFGVDNPAWASADILGRSIWEWISGPSVAMCVVIGLAIWTTTGTFMLLFLAALQDLPVEVDEAAMLDGVGPWQKLRHITLPMIKPTLFLVITLGLIGTWQVFDQIYVMGKGAPAGTTLTPAYLSYQESFRSLKYGTGAAMAFIVFVIIVLLTWFQRWLMSEDRGTTRRTRRAAGVAVGLEQGTHAGGPG